MRLLILELKTKDLLCSIDFLNETAKEKMMEKSKPFVTNEIR